MAGRPSHKPTPESRAQVEALCTYGVPREKIGEYIGINTDTLAKYYGDELTRAATKANATVASFLFRSASGQAIDEGATYGECNRAAMFWLKTRARWRETTHIDATSSDGTMTPKTFDPSKMSTAWLQELLEKANDSGDNSD